MEELSPKPCPSTVTVRRNPPRKARATPYTTAAKPPPSANNTHDVPTFPIDEILSIQIPPQPEPKPSGSESLKIFLRIKPLRILTKANATKSRPRNVWPQNPSKRNNNMAKESRLKKSEEVCITLNDSYSVTLTPPQALQELKRSKTEVFEGFSHVFPANCSQNDVYGKMVQPLLEDFLNGKSGMLAALGPSGSGKTHTVFGTVKDPGVVPLTLRQIFKKSDGTSSSSSSLVSLRLFYLSIFEICSERGKGEKAYDLLGDGSSELSVQQSTIRGLKEVPIPNLEEAESLIGQAMLKRATATTNSNSQSSRSQCIINIRASSDGVSNETKVQSSDAMLTIVDLAGAEREKRTGNQGERLVESNFINNTSMVFGQCLRSLLEYQKNRKKGLQKHHQNSLLTRYLRDYLEGKKRMALIITVKSGEEDYLDTSYLLKQASPYMKIKFDNIEEVCNKRQLKTFPRVEKNKKMKLSGPKTSQIAEIVAGEKKQIAEEVNLEGKKINKKEKSSPKLEHASEDNNEREHIIMRNFAKTVWNVLKQYNEKLKVAEGDICSLKESLRSEQLKSRGLETELLNLKSSCLYSKSNMAEPCLPEVEALVHAKEELEVVTSLANADTFQTNVDDDLCNLFDSRIEFTEEEWNESPLPNKNVVLGLGNGESSCDKQDNPCNLIDSRREVTAEGFNASPVPKENVVPGLGNEGIFCEEPKFAKQDDPSNLIDSTREVTEGCNKSPVQNKNVLPGLGNEENSCEEQECAKQVDPTPSPEQVEAGLINNRLSNIQTKSAVSRRFPDSVKQERLRRLLPASSRLLSEETDDLEIKDNQKEKPQVKFSKNRDQEKKSDSTQGGETEIPAREADPASTKKQRNEQKKPRRRLQPASSVLLTREINTLEIEDDVTEPKGTRGGKKTTMAQPRSQGSVTLLRLLTSNLHL